MKFYMMIMEVSEGKYVAQIDPLDEIIGLSLPVAKTIFYSVEEVTVLTPGNLEALRTKLKEEVRRRGITTNFF